MRDKLQRTAPASPGERKPATHLTKPGDGFQSEFEQFLDQYKAAHPDVEEDQRRGWYIWWDHQVEPSDREVRRKDSIPVKPYAYD